jgi:hypothetical protein
MFIKIIKLLLTAFCIYLTSYGIFNYDEFYLKFVQFPIIQYSSLYFLYYVVIILQLMAVFFYFTRYEKVQFFIFVVHSSLFTLFYFNLYSTGNFDCGCYLNIFGINVIGNLFIFLVYLIVSAYCLTFNSIKNSNKKQLEIL